MTYLWISASLLDYDPTQVVDGFVSPHCSMIHKSTAAIAKKSLGYLEKFLSIRDPVRLLESDLALSTCNILVVPV